MILRLCAQEVLAPNGGKTTCRYLRLTACADVVFARTWWRGSAAAARATLTPKANRQIGQVPVQSYHLGFIHIHIYFIFMHIKVANSKSTVGRPSFLSKTDFMHHSILCIFWMTVHYIVQWIYQKLKFLNASDGRVRFKIYWADFIHEVDVGMIEDINVKIFVKKDR